MKFHRAGVYQLLKNLAADWDSQLSLEDNEVTTDYLSCARWPHEEEFRIIPSWVLFQKIKVTELYKFTARFPLLSLHLLCHLLYTPWSRYHIHPCSSFSLMKPNSVPMYQGQDKVWCTLGPHAITSIHTISTRSLQGQIPTGLLNESSAITPTSWVTFSVASDLPGRLQQRQRSGATDVLLNKSQEMEKDNRGWTPLWPPFRLGWKMVWRTKLSQCFSSNFCQNVSLQKSTQTLCFAVTSSILELLNISTIASDSANTEVLRAQQSLWMMVERTEHRENPSAARCCSNKQQNTGLLWCTWTTDMWISSFCLWGIWS